MFFSVGYAAAMPDTQPAALAWLHPLTLRAMKSAAAGALASGRGTDTAAEAARAVALARYPALPLPMIAEAVAAALAQPQAGGGVAGRLVSTMPPSRLRLGWSQAPALGFRPLAYQTLPPLCSARNARQPGATGCGP
jgi:hypothetical protein